MSDMKAERHTDLITREVHPGPRQGCEHCKARGAAVRAPRKTTAGAVDQPNNSGHRLGEMFAEMRDEITKLRERVDGLEERERARVEKSARHHGKGSGS